MWSKKKDFDYSILIERIETIEEKITQLECSKTGHDFVYEKITILRAWDANSYTFKCDKCNLRVFKYIEDLTALEKKALRTLGILYEPPVNSREKK